ncbi:MAG: cupin domain-containing protein [Solobacterium sp.]|jgi:quercetin dioxygenase-like cupin family protein|nr:cupin domain-containing protein [Solobacterium sp.]
MSVVKDQIWLSDRDVEGVAAAEGVERRIKSYTDELMVVENVFQKGAVGALHSHPHTQITYVVSGKFEFNIGGEKRIVTAGDTMLKKNGIEHGCVCLEAGILLDIFSPMREDFVK